MKSVGLRTKELKTLLGSVTHARSLFTCSHCRTSRIPADEELDTLRTGFSPGVRRRIARAASRGSFIEAEKDLWIDSHIRAGRRDIERISEQIGRDIDAWRARKSAQPPSQVSTLYVSFDGTQVPIRKKEIQGRKGKQPDGSAKGREAKIGCVFTQTHNTPEGFPLRDEASTTYVSGIESSTFFGERIYREALARGLDNAQRLVVLTDGAAYNKTIAQTHFPHAVHVIDLYHAREHLHELIQLLRPPEGQAQCLERWKTILDKGDIPLLIKEARAVLPRSGPRRKDALAHIGYFQKNAPHMRYAHFRKHGLFVGSGVVEAGCRLIVGRRLKQPGMFWSVRGSHAILQLRSCILSDQFDDYWEDRAAS